MGTHREFLCTGCGYAAHASGGSDVGRASATETITCRGCQEVFDVVTRSYELGNFPPPDDEATGSPAAEPACPEDPTHAVEPWDASHPCPKCGKPMREGEGFILWD